MFSISSDDVAAIIHAQLGHKLPYEVIARSDAVLEDLGLSSLDVTEAFVAIEELVERELDPLSASDAKTLGDLVAAVNAQLAVVAPTTQPVR
ncbi:MAG: acyl carrier protein [Conexibacter sp.]